MKSVFLLQHVRDIDGQDDAKVIGIYSDLSQAEEAMVRTLKLPGFCDHPDGFLVDEYPLDEDNWTDGFVTIST